jgi:hypothetical protein
VKKFNGLILSIFMAIIILLAVFLVIPLGAMAHSPVVESEPSSLTVSDDSPAAIGQQAIIGGSDVQLSSNGASLPKIAANQYFAAVVFQQSGNIYLRATKGATGWLPATTVGVGANPNLVFSETNTDTVHIVWEQDDNKIQYRKCTLAQSSMSCNDPSTVASDADSDLGTPDIVVDKTSHYLHVVWVKDVSPDADSIQTVRSSSSETAGTVSWGTVVPVGGPTNPQQPVLAATAGYIHLAFVDAGGASLYYYRSSDSSSPSWGTSKSFAAPLGYSYGFGNPAIAAAGNNVFLAWDNTDGPSTIETGGRYYALIGAKSTDNGSSWLDANTKHITSTHLASGGDIYDKKLSKSTGFASPPIENALRPQVAVTGTADFVAVWQQRPAELDPSQEESPNCTSEIYYADSEGGNWANEQGQLADAWNTYSIAPDVVVDPNSVKHIVFMKASDNGTCAGGGASDYAIYYRGPYTTVLVGNTVYLPLIMKNW